MLRDEDPAERKAGIEAGFAFRSVCAYTVVYTDLGISRGMQLGIDHAKSQGLEVRERSIVWPQCGDRESEADYIWDRRDLEEQISELSVELEYAQRGDDA